MALRRRRAATTPMLYRLCSLFLQYPDEELRAGHDELARAVRELPRSEAAGALEQFCEWWGNEDPLALEQHYVETFDMHKRCGLYVTFYGEGDKRDRGPALLRLKRMYRAAGLPLEGAGELPDYLPVMLEFAALAPGGKGEIVLREHRAAIELLRQGLHDRGTPYARVLDAVSLAVGELSAADRARALKLAASGPPQELVGLEPFTPPEIVHSGGEARR
jgi:nitrate reductase molybdenum cofactor assembly chaperone NarJ/NarW